MRRKLRVLAACVAIAVASCAAPGGTGGSTPDPIVGVWKLASIHGVPPTADPTGTIDWTMSILADGSTNGALAATAAPFGPSTMMFFGYWSGGAGTYPATFYNAGTDTHSYPATATLSGTTLTITHPGPSGNYVSVFTPAGAPAASDAIIGLWNETAVSPPGSGVTSETMSCRSDGSLVAGTAAGGGTFGNGHTTVFGHWSKGVTDYTASIYVPGGGSTAIVETGTVSGSTCSVTGPGPSGPCTTDFSRVAAPAAGDPIVGVWRLASIAPPPTAGLVDSTLSIQADGSFTGAQAATAAPYGPGTVYLVGNWSNSAGNYALKIYISGNSNTVAVAQTATVAGTTLSVSGTGPAGPAVFTFTRY
jgi:hypothetical protein